MMPAKTVMSTWQREKLVNTEGCRCNVAAAGGGWSFYQMNFKSLCESRADRNRVQSYPKKHYAMELLSLGICLLLALWWLYEYVTPRPATQIHHLTKLQKTIYKNILKTI